MTEIDTIATSELPDIKTLSDLKDSGCCIDLLQTRVLSCEGPDAKSFLQGQLTCDLETLPLPSPRPMATLGSCCTPQGRMVSMFHIVMFSETHYWLITHESNGPALLQHLSKYSVFSKVTLTLKEAQLQGIITRPDSPASQAPTLIATQIPYLYFTATPLEATLPTADPVYWHLAWLQVGLVQFSQEFSGEYMPSDLHLDDMGGVSYNKGCYTGQEPIARLHFRGTSKFTCRLLTWPKVSLKDHSLQIDGKNVGKLVQTLQLKDQCLSLARIRIDALQLVQEDTSQRLTLTDHTGSQLHIPKTFTIDR